VFGNRFGIPLHQRFNLQTIDALHHEVLLAMSDTPKSLVSFSAQMTLKQWREGKRFP